MRKMYFFYMIICIYVMYNTFLNDYGHGIQKCVSEKTLKMQQDIEKTNPSEKWLPKSNPYFFIYSPQSDIFTTLPPTMKFSIYFFYILPRHS